MSSLEFVKRYILLRRYRNQSKIDDHYFTVSLDQNFFLSKYKTSDKI